MKGRKGRSARDRGEQRPHLAETGRRRFSMPQRHADAIRARFVPRPWTGIRRALGASYVSAAARADRRRRPRARAPRRTAHGLGDAPRSSARVQSALVAPPAFSMKFACLGEISAPPIRCPFRPHSSSILPAPTSPGGFLKTLPKVRLFVGWVSFRRPIEIGDGRLDLCRRARLEPELDPRDDVVRSQLRVAVREAERLGRHPRLPVGGHDERAYEHVRPVAPVRTGVHEHAAACGSGDRARELEPTEPGLAGAVEAHRVRRAPAGLENAVASVHRWQGRPRAAARARRRRRRRRARSSPARPPARRALRRGRTAAPRTARRSFAGARTRAPDRRVPIVVSRASGTPCSISITREGLRRPRARPATALRHRV